MNTILILLTIFGFILLPIGLIILFTNVTNDEKEVLGYILGTTGVLLIAVGTIGLSVKLMREKHTVVITTSNGVVEEYEKCNYKINRDKITVITSEGETIYYYNPCKVKEIK